MIIIITRENCSNCDTSKTMLRGLGLEFLEYKIDVNITREEVLEQYPGRKMLPIIIDKYNEMASPRLASLKKYLYEVKSDERRITE